MEMAALKANRLLLHGYAVAVDMALTAVLSQMRGLITNDDLGRILTLLRRLTLPIWHQYLIDGVLMSRATEDAITSRDGELRLTMLDGIGGCHYESDISMDEINRGVEILTKLHKMGGPK
jgi:3-dehydroquinate synthase